MVLENAKEHTKHLDSVRKGCLYIAPRRLKRTRRKYASPYSAKQRRRKIGLSWKSLVNHEEAVGKGLRPGEVFMLLSFSCVRTDICQGYLLDSLRLCICFQLKWSRCENPGLSIVFALLVTPRRIRIYFNPPEDSTHSRAGSHTLK